MHGDCRRENNPYPGSPIRLCIEDAHEKVRRKMMQNCTFMGGYLEEDLEKHVDTLQLSTWKLP